jgi:hypothetical protein
MFTSNGKTRCILDQEVDYTQYLNYSQAQAQQQPGGQPRANPPAAGTNPTGPPTPTPPVVQPPLQTNGTAPPTGALQPGKVGGQVRPTPPLSTTNPGNRILLVNKGNPPNINMQRNPALRQVRIQHRNN